jgi:hypothetical protein
MARGFFNSLREKPKPNGSIFTYTDWQICKSSYWTGTPYKTLAIVATPDSWHASTTDYKYLDKIHEDYRGFLLNVNGSHCDRLPVEKPFHPTSIDFESDGKSNFQYVFASRQIFNQYGPRKKNS